MAIAYVTIPKLSRKDVRRFWSKVKVAGQDECWNWSAYRKKDRGYGYVGIGPKVYIAHRVACSIANPEFKHDLNVLHSCDNPSCCNPRHLFQGTQLDNVRDMIAKGRMRHATGDASGPRLHPDRVPRGERQGLSKLTADAVADIRRRYDGSTVLLRDLASKHGVTLQTVWAVLKRITWKHIP